MCADRTLGYRLGKGESMKQIIDSMQGAVAEGVQTTKAAKRLADKLGVSTPIIQGLYRLLFGEHHLHKPGMTFHKPQHMQDGVFISIPHMHRHSSLSGQLQNKHVMLVRKLLYHSLHHQQQQQQRHQQMVVWGDNRCTLAGNRCTLVV